VAEYGLDASGSGLGPMMGSCEHCNKNKGSVIGGKFLH
jgi:hypothetical protein